MTRSTESGNAGRAEPCAVLKVTDVILVPLAALAIGAAPLLAGCGAAATHDVATGIPAGGSMLPDVRTAKDRPPVVLVTRDGDPASAVAVAVATAGTATTTDDEDAEAAVALAGVVEARLATRAVSARATPQWDGYRVVVLAASASEAADDARAMRAALAAPVDERDLAAAKKKLAALAQRPLRDVALGTWARCAASPFAVPSRAGKSGADLTLAQLETWRSTAHGLGRVAFAVAGPSTFGEAVAKAVADDAEWKTSSALRRSRAGSDDVAVYDASAETVSSPAVVHATLDVPTSSGAVATADALGDPHGPLATRLAALELPFRLREVVGTAHPHGGCVGFVLEATGSAQATSTTGELASRVADAVALVRLEADVHLAEGGSTLDGRTLARRAGDPRDAAERAAWWSLADEPRAKGGPSASPLATTHATIALGVSSRRTAPPASSLDPLRDALKLAMERAASSWQKPVVEGRTRVEPGQGETWLLVASPCGTDAETDTDAGLAALFTVAAAELTKSSSNLRVEPWVASDGIGLVVHGPALPGETPSAHARRLADAVAESFAATPLTTSSLMRARAELQRRDGAADGAALAALADAVSPQHPSWFVPWGREESLVRAADAAVAARAQALRAGPLRVAVLANVDAAQGDAARRAVDRWVERRPGETRACRPSSAPAPSRPGTYTAALRPGATPEALLAFPFVAGDDRLRAAAELVAAALDGPAGLLEASVSNASGLSRAASARVLGWPRTPALVVRVASSQTALDGAVMQTRALLDRLHKSGLSDAAFERAVGRVVANDVTTTLEPRARLVDVWRGRAIPSAASAKAAPPASTATRDEVRAFLQKWLGEETLVVVAARPPRSPSP